MELADQKKKRRLLHLSKTGRRRLLVPTAFFLAVIYYEELFMKLFCFHSLSPAGAFFTLLFSIPVAVLLGLLCGGVHVRRGGWLLVGGAAHTIPPTPPIPARSRWDSRAAACTSGGDGGW